MKARRSCASPEGTRRAPTPAAAIALRSAASLRSGAAGSVATDAPARRERSAERAGRIPETRSAPAPREATHAAIPSSAARIWPLIALSPSIVLLTPTSMHRVDTYFTTLTSRSNK
eukprot:scaffold43845_cov33-Tisochrysis_lutea.AAC.2